MDIIELKSLLLEIKKINSIQAVLHWDQETYMPEGSGNIRAEHISLLSSLAHKLHTGEKFKTLLAKVVDLETGEPLDTANEPNTNRLLYLIWKDFRDASALPDSFVRDVSLHVSKSQQVWAKSRMENDFDTFAPYLEKMINFKKQEAEYYGYNTTPYDSLLDKYEPDMTAEKLTQLFKPLQQRLVSLVKAIKNSTTVIDEETLKKSFDVSKQWDFGMKVVEAMGFDLRYGRQDRSVHPFTTSFHPTDVRITTRLDEHSFKTAFFGTVHEAGHALYEQGLPVGHYGTPFGDAISYGFHESQSRLWENLVARGTHFWDHFYPVLQEHFPNVLKSVDQQQFYRMINTVSPSLIRVEADDLYAAHYAPL